MKESGITYDDYRTALHNTNLDSEDRRRYVLGFVENQMAVLKKALDGNMDAISNFSELTENLNLRDRQKWKTLFLLEKYMVIFMIMADPDLKDDKYLPVAFTFGARYCDRLLRNLRGQLLKTVA